MATSRYQSSDKSGTRYGPRSLIIMALVLAVCSLALFSPAVTHDFINYDDPDYVTQNPHVQSGFSKENLGWAFGRVAGEATYWHPVTWMSHMLDCQMFGMKPAGHHAVNVLFHSINTVLLFLFLHRATGAFWRSAAAAMLFAIHPLQVDTVAWVTERKNVLSTCLWFLTLIAYLRFTEESRRASSGPRWFFYILTLALFSLGLMSKPMLVTVPFLLLLLDVWPLKRIELAPGSLNGWGVLKLIAEKVPFFVLSGISAAITIAAHKKLNLVVSERELSFTERLINSASSYLNYFCKVFWPTNLAIYYPIPETWSGTEIVVAVGFLCLVLTSAIFVFRRFPFVSLGCFWFLGTLVPVIGVLQVGLQSMADRFTYVPIVGLFIAIVWGTYEIARHWRIPVKLLACTVGIVLLALGVATSVQLSHWKNSRTLFAHAAKVIPNNVVAEVMLGSALEQEGNVDGALRQYEKALEMKPGFPHMHYNIGNLLARENQLDAAITHYRQAIAMNSSYADWHYNLGVVLDMKGQRKEAITAYKSALAIRPDDYDATKALGLDLAAENQPTEALQCLKRAIAMQTDDSKVRLEAAKVLAAMNHFDEAAQQCEAVLHLEPQSFEGHVLLGTCLIAKGDKAQGLIRFKEALQLQPGNQALRERVATLEHQR